MKKWQNIIRENRNFRIVAFANLINRLGDSAETIAYTYLLYHFTNSAAISALGLCVNLLPTVFLQPLAGAFIEGKNPKRIMITSDIVRGLLVIGLILLFLTDNLKYPLFMLTIFMISVVECFRVPAGMSIFPFVCDENDYETQASLNSAINTIAAVAGVSIAGWLLKQTSFFVIFALDAVTYFASAIILSLLKIAIMKNEGSAEKQNDREGILIFLKEGVWVLWEDRGLREVLMLAVINNLLACPYQALEAPIVNGMLRGDAGLLSCLSISGTVGVIAASAVFGGVREKMSAQRMVRLGILSYALEYIGFALISEIRSYVIMVVTVIILILVCTVIQTWLAIYISTLFIEKIPKDKIARAGATFNSLISMVVPITSLAISGMVLRIPIVIILDFISLISVIAAVLWGISKKKNR